MKAKIAVVGTGWWATTAHLPGLTAHPDAQVVAVCDLDESKAQKAAEVFQIGKVYTDVDTLLAQETLDGIVVATYHATHYEVARKSLEHGLHTYIEKPMVLYAHQARHLVELAEANGLQIVMGYNHNHNHHATRSREVIHSGELGAIQYITGQFSQAIYDLLAGKTDFVRGQVHSPGDVYSDPVRSGGGHGHLQLTHLAGMVFFITGLRIQRVQAWMANHGLAVDLVNAVTAQSQSGALITVGGTSNVRGGGRGFKLTIYCENGWIDIDDATGTATIRCEGHDPEVITPADAPTHQHHLFNPINNFVDVIVKKADNLCSGVVGWRAVELLDAAYRSAASDGQTVYLEELYQEEKT